MEILPTLFISELRSLEHAESPLSDRSIQFNTRSSVEPRQVNLTKHSFVSRVENQPLWYQLDGTWLAGVCVIICWYWSTFLFALCIHNSDLMVSSNLLIDECEDKCRTTAGWVLPWSSLFLQLMVTEMLCIPNSSQQQRRENKKCHPSYQLQP